MLTACIFTSSSNVLWADVEPRDLHSACSVARSHIQQQANHPLQVATTISLPANCSTQTHTQAQQVVAQVVGVSVATRLHFAQGGLDHV